jgi:hypothetical protein
MPTVCVKSGRNGLWRHLGVLMHISVWTKDLKDENHGLRALGMYRQ